MRSDESGRSGATPQSFADPERPPESEGSAGVFCCPECGARLRLAGGISVQRVGRSDQPDRSPTASTGASPQPAAPTGEPAESIEVSFDSAEAEGERPAPVQRLPESSAPSQVAAAGASAEGDDDPTRVQCGFESLAAPMTNVVEGEGDVADIDSYLESPIPPECRVSGEEHEPRTLRRPPSVPDHGGSRLPVGAAETVHGSLGHSATAVAPGASGAPVVSGQASGSPVAPVDVSSGSPDTESSLDDPDDAPEPSPQPVARAVFSDAPLTRDAKTEPRRESARGYVGLGIGMAALGVAFMVYSQLRTTDSEDRGSPAAAVSPTTPMMPAAQAVPSAAALGAPLAEPPAAALGAPPAEPPEVEPASPEPAPAKPVIADTKGVQPPSRASLPQATAEAVSSAAELESEAEPEEAKFDAEVAASALDSAAGRASSCRRASDPSGVALVTITFAPSGRVTTATISGPPFVGTATGSCIASTLRSAQIPAFVGELVTVRKKVTIR